MNDEYREVFDETLSSDASLSKILDAFIIENESPETIIVFLRQHDEFFKDIISRSAYWTRLFQLDFILQCDESQAEYVFSKLKLIDMKIAAYFCWQIYASKSYVSNKLKWKFKDEIKSALERLNEYPHIVHPYSHLSGKDVRRIDEILLKACIDQDFPAAIASLSYPDFKTIVTLSHSSLFRYRICSLDVFQELDNVQKWVLLQETTYFSDSAIINFVWQLLDSNEDIEVKMMLLHSIDEQQSEICIAINESPYEKYFKCGSFSEILLTATIEGNYDMTMLAKCLVGWGKWKILKEWANANANSLNAALNISDAILKFRRKK